METIVGLDMRPTEKGFKAHAGRGTGRYAEELTKELMAMSKEAAQLGIRLKPIRSADFSSRNCLDTVSSLLPFGRRTFESQFVYSRRIASIGASLGVQLVHFFSHGDAPAICALPQTVTVLDLIPLIFPDLYRAKKNNYRFRFARFLEYQAISRSLGIFAISQCTKRDIVRLLGVSPERIVVTPLAVSGEFMPRALDSEREMLNSMSEERRRFGISPHHKVLLYVGGIDPRKNVLFLLGVLRELLTHAESEERLLLVMAGNYTADDQFPRLKAEISRLSLEEHVRLLGFVPDAELGSLYRAADIFVFPSLYEGFGLPPLEAMRSGVPVVAGNNSSLPEVVGGAGMLCADNQTQSWAEAILQLMASSAHCLEYARRGVLQAEKFSWRSTANKTLQAFSRFVGGADADRKS